MNADRGGGRRRSEAAPAELDEGSRQADMFGPRADPADGLPAPPAPPNPRAVAKTVAADLAAAAAPAAAPSRPARSTRSRRVAAAQGLRAPDPTSAEVEDSALVEYEDARAAGMLGFMDHTLVQAALPHSDPGSPYFQRFTGLLTLSIVGVPDIGVPYGSIPRVLLAWLCTEAVRTQSPELSLGRSQAEFMRKLQMHTGGSYTGPLRDQTRRLFKSPITIEQRDSDRGDLWENMRITKRGRMLRDPHDPNAVGPWQSTLLLDPSFYQQVVDKPVPLDLRVMQALRHSPLAMDIYTWLKYRSFVALQQGRREVFVPWEGLRAQFGAGHAVPPPRARGRVQIPETPEPAARAVRDQSAKNFKAQFLRRLRDVQRYFPTVPGNAVQPQPGGLLFYPDRLRALALSPGAGAPLLPPTASPTD